MGKIEPRYTTTATITGGREGRAVTDDGVLDVELRRPKTNGISDGTNPEQLFAAAWGGCWQQALIAIAKQQGLDASNSTVQVEVAVGTMPDGDSALAARINVSIPGMDDATVQSLADAANQRCVYSKATRGNIAVEVNATGA